MAKVKFYYLPDFYSEKSKGKIGGFRTSDHDESLTGAEVLSEATNGVTIIIAPASKRQLAKADAELLAVLKEEGNKKEG